MKKKPDAKCIDNAICAHLHTSIGFSVLYVETARVCFYASALACVHQFLCVKKEAERRQHANERERIRGWKMSFKIDSFQ